VNTVATIKESKIAACQEKRTTVLDPLLKKLVHLAMHHARIRTCASTCHAHTQAHATHICGSHMYACARRCCEIIIVVCASVQYMPCISYGRSHTGYVHTCVQVNFNNSSDLSANINAMYSMLDSDDSGN
jgi:hypothetical protein